MKKISTWHAAGLVGSQRDQLTWVQQQQLQKLENTL